MLAAVDGKKQSTQERAIAILRGHEDAPTETIAFVAKKANAAKQRGEVALKELAGLQKRIEEVQAVVIGVRGALESYKADVVELLEEVTKAPAD